VNDPQRHFATVKCSIAKGSFDHLVGACEHGRRNGEAERLVAAEMMRWLNSIFAARRSECSEQRSWQMKLVGSFHCEHAIGYRLT
jgi:hypothetical protein